MNATKATMNVCCFRTFGLIAGRVALLLPIQAYALSLGGFEVESALDEPLRAEIQLQSVDADDLESLEVTLGSAEDFQRADVPRAEFLRQLQFEVTETSDGGAVVRVSSEQPMKEPFLHFLIAAEWSGGKLVREYTGLLDPPLYASDEPAEIEPPATASSEAPAAQPSSDQAATVGEPASVAPSGAAGGGAAEYGPTREGDTLWDIASRLDTGAVQANVFQIMIALQRQNPDAFINNNINRLRTGATLRLDDIAAVAQIPAQQASAAYTAQLEEWQATRTQVAEAGGDTGTADSAAMEASADAGAEDAEAAEAPADQAMADTGATPAEAESAESGEDVLRIVQATVEETGEAESASAGNDLSGEVAALRGQIATLEESLESRNLENEELRERVRLLEGQLENAQRLIEIESQELAAAQQQAAQAQAEAAEAQAEARAQAQARADQAQADQPGSSAEAGSVAANDSEAANASQQSAASAVQPVEESGQQATGSSPAAEQSADNTAAGDSAPAAQEPGAGQTASQQAGQSSQQASAAAGGQAGENTQRVRTGSSGSGGTSWMSQIPDMLFSSWMWMVGAALGVLVLVLGLLMFLRRRQSIAEFEESILSGSALDSYSETSDTAATSSASDTSFLSDFGTAGMGTMQADEVDPLAEAEVYLAYGRDEQAEDVLKDAARRDPERSEIKLKLLEIYKQRNDVKSFETIAEELYPAGDSGDREAWAQVSAMGREISPSNPLFQEAAPAPAAGGEAPAADEPGQPAPAAEAGAASTESMEFNLDNLEPAQETAPVAPENAASATGGNELDFDLETGMTEEPQSPTAETVEATRDDTTLDFADSFMEQPSANVDPATQPFPAPDQQTDLDAEFERLANEREATATPQAANSESGGAEEMPAASQAPEWDMAESDAGTLDFPSSDNSDIDFELELDDNSVQQLSGGGASGNSGSPEQQPAAQAADASEDPFGDGLLEFESENIPPEETWAGPSSDAAPGSSGDSEDSVTYTPNDDVQSEGAPQYNEAETKLDLARAYLDMGDKVGARSIIDEVMREGDPSQRDQAAALAAQL